MARLEDIRTGKRLLTDQDGAFIATSTKSETTPQSSATPTRRYTAWTTDNEKVDL